MLFLFLVYHPSIDHHSEKGNEKDWANKSTHGKKGKGEHSKHHGHRKGH